MSLIFHKYQAKSAHVSGENRTRMRVVPTYVCKFTRTRMQQCLHTCVNLRAHLLTEIYAHTQGK
jgi:hypothetical protein